MALILISERAVGCIQLTMTAAVTPTFARRLLRGTHSLRETWRHRRAKRRRTFLLARRIGVIGSPEHASCLAPQLKRVSCGAFANHQMRMHAPG